MFPNSDPVMFMVAFYGCLLAELVPVPIEVPLTRKVARLGRAWAPRASLLQLARQFGGALHAPGNRPRRRPAAGSPSSRLPLVRRGHSEQPSIFSSNE